MAVSFPFSPTLALCKTLVQSSKNDFQAILRDGDDYFWLGASPLANAQIGNRSDNGPVERWFYLTLLAFPLFFSHCSPAGRQHDGWRQGLAVPLCKASLSYTPLSVDSACKRLS